MSNLKELFKKNKKTVIILSVIVLAGIFFELHDPIDQSEKREILAHADIQTWVHLGAMLAHKDVARQNGLASKLLYAKPLAGTVAAVA